MENNNKSIAAFHSTQERKPYECFAVHLCGTMRRRSTRHTFKGNCGGSNFRIVSFDVVVVVVVRGSESGQRLQTDFERMNLNSKISFSGFEICWAIRFFTPQSAYCPAKPTNRSVYVHYVVHVFCVAWFRIKRHTIAACLNGKQQQPSTTTAQQFPHRNSFYC